MAVYFYICLEPCAFFSHNGLNMNMYMLHECDLSINTRLDQKAAQLHSYMY